MTDPVTSEIIRNYLETVAAEIVGTMVRTAVSPIFNEAHDCSAGVFTWDGSTVSLVSRADAAPVHIYAALASVEASLDFFRGDLSPGDVIIVCDPYYGGSHLPDYTVVLPVFIDGEPWFFPSVRGHMPDAGGPQPGGNMAARDIWQEGFRFAPMKLYRGGERRADVWRWLTSNNRFPDALEADVDAMIGGCRVGARRIAELCERYGSETVRSGVEWVMDYSERRMRDRIRAWEDGVYRASSQLDSDFVTDEPVDVVATVTIEGDRLVVDFEGSSPQSPGIINSVPANTLAFVCTAFSALCPEIPINSGFFRPIQVRLPPGSVVNPDPPAPVRAATVSIGADIGDVVMKAAEGFAPERVGTCSLDLLGPWFWGVDGRSRRPFLHYELLSMPTAAGGVYGSDGWGAWPATFSSADVPSVEMSEVQYPVLYRRWEYEIDTAAPGRWRGGPAWVTERVGHGMDGPLYHTIRMQGATYPLHGFCGGCGAVGNYVVLRPGSGRAEVVARYTDTGELEGDAAVLFHKCGGGGWGDARERDPEAVLRDVCDGIVSIEGALEDYGVVIDEHSLVLDLEATAAARAADRAPDWRALGRRRVLAVLQSIDMLNVTC